MQIANLKCLSTPPPIRLCRIMCVCMCWHVKRWFVLCVCVNYRVETLVLDVCLVKFCEDISFIVEIVCS